MGQRTSTRPLSAGKENITVTDSRPGGNGPCHTIPWPDLIFARSFRCSSRMVGLPKPTGSGIS